VHNNYFFLKKLSESLKSKICKYTFAAIFSQNKDELVVELAYGQKNFIIKADLKSQFSCLSFPGQYSRARKNSIDLFPEIIGKKILDIHQYHHERAFSFVLEEDYVFVFKLFGNFSNILLYKDGLGINVFKHGKGDCDMLNMNVLDRKIDPLPVDEEISSGILTARFPSFDRNIINYLESNGLTEFSDNALRSKLVSDLMALLENPRYYVYTKNNDIKFSLLPGDGESKQFTDPIEAVNYFYSEYQKRSWLENEKKMLGRQLRLKLKKTNSYVHKSNIKLEELRKAGNFRQIGDIIMVNLHNIPVGLNKVELFDFYNSKNIQIKLKPNLSAQKNAEQYYRKAKNQKIEVASLEKNINNKRNQADRLKEYLNIIEDIDNLNELRLFASKNYLVTKVEEKRRAEPRFKIYDHMGFQIFVGRNAKNNDELTFRYGYKEDLWLHAKDVKGSHVLIKYQAGKNFPKPVITLAAQLAAYNSANKNSDTCPVIYTPKKYVRKSKGMPAGAVILDKEEIIFVKPEDH
jgi:predicted ribosome quality control (RQC) complex YloA/Tae2 family protein